MKRASVLLVACLFLGQSLPAQEDPPSPDMPSMPDAASSIDSEVKAMDRTVEDAVKETDNAAMRSVTESSSGESRTVTHSSSSSVEGSIGIPIPTPGGAGEIVWPFGHHKHHQDAANPALGAEVEAGPIWNNDDANRKCPSVCSKVNQNWTGQWRTTTQGSMSVCSCGTGNAANSSGGPVVILPNSPSASGPGSSCSAPSNYQCRGCSVSCPAGKQAHCTTGDRGIFNGPSDAICQTDAKCECQ